MAARRPATQAAVKPAVKNIAIACQGGGSHTAFTAGVLQSFLRGIDPARHRIIGLSGTSGGALCAALAWVSLLEGLPEVGVRRLESFWQKMAATQIPDVLSNQWLMFQQRSRAYFGMPEISPYLLPNTGQDFMETLLKEHIPFAKLPALITSQSPALMIGAVEVLSGNFKVFHSHATGKTPGISVKALLASTAIPELFRAVPVDDGLYWDGLFSENPPIRSFLAGKTAQNDKPDEIWLIRINPKTRDREPHLVSDITDRRNELAGNLSLEQELFFVEQTNDWLAKGWLNAGHFKPVKVRQISLNRDLDYASKLDRSPNFINSLMEDGRQHGADFIARHD